MPSKRKKRTPKLHKRLSPQKARRLLHRGLTKHGSAQPPEAPSPEIANDAYPNTESIFRLKPAHWAFIVDKIAGGETDEALVARYGYSRKTLHSWRQRFGQLFLAANPDFMKLMARLTAKALRVIEDNLSGKPSIPGADLMAARMVLQATGVAGAVQGLPLLPGPEDPEGGDQGGDGQPKVVNLILNKTVIHYGNEPDDGFADALVAFARGEEGLPENSGSPEAVVP